MSQTSEPNPVYFHDCPALGPHVRVPRALLTDNTNTYVLCYHHKCVFCSYTAGEREMAKGVTETATGYRIDPSIAEKLHNA